MNNCRMLFLLIALVWTCAAQDITAQSDAAAPLAQGAATTNALNCESLAARDSTLDLISKFCEFALTYRRQLPDFIAQQTTTFGGAHAVLTAQVTFRNGMESYSYLTLEGRPITDKRSLPSIGPFASAGEFGSLLVDLFAVPGAVEFKFRKTSTLEDVPVSIYEFRLPKEKNTFWALRDGSGREWKPEFRGEIWLEQQTGRPRREVIGPVHLPTMCLIGSARTITDYAMTMVKEVGTFLLPVKSVSTVCNRLSQGAATMLSLQSGDVSMAGQQLPASCATNILVFHDYRKFVASARIVPAKSQP